MKYKWAAVLFFVSTLAVPAFAQQTMTKGSKSWDQLQSKLWNVEQEWLCLGPYHKTKQQECVDSRAKYWPPLFFEIGQNGILQDKRQMVAGQTASAPAADVANPKGLPGPGPNPEDFKLMAVYGNVALAADRTVFKSIDPSGNLHVTSQTRVLRVFVKLNGKWKPASAALVRIP